MYGITLASTLSQIVKETEIESTQMDRRPRAYENIVCYDLCSNTSSVIDLQYSNNLVQEYDKKNILSQQE